MFKKILVAVDGSSYSKGATKVAITMAKPLSAEVSVVYVIPKALPYAAQKYDHPAPDPSYSEFLKNQGNQILDVAKHIAEDENIKAKTVLLEGQPVDEILRYVNQHDFDLIILGHRGTKRSKTFLLGSVSERVARAAKCSVLIVK